jgi:hypothetical protein
MRVSTDTQEDFKFTSSFKALAGLTLALPKKIEHTRKEGFAHFTLPFLLIDAP